MTSQVHQTEFQAREQSMREHRIAEYDRFAEDRDRWRAKNAAYYRHIQKLVQFVVPKG